MVGRNPSRKKSVDINFYSDIFDAVEKIVLDFYFIWNIAAHFKYVITSLIAFYAVHFYKYVS